jgi:hypothetical protein
VDSQNWRTTEEIMLALLWTVFSLFLAAGIWRTARQHSRPELGFSTTHNHREEFFSRFVKKMSVTAVSLCLMSAVAVWFFHAWFLGIVFMLAIPAVAALQVVRSKKAIENSGNRSLPRFP